MLRFWLQLIPCITCIHAEALQEGLLADDGSIALFRLLSFEQAMSSITEGYSMLGSWCKHQVAVNTVAAMMDQLQVCIFASIGK